MNIRPLVDKVRAFIEFETGLKTAEEFTGNGVAIGLISPNGWILGVTCVKLSLTKMPLVFTNSTGFFKSHGGMTLASQFRSMYESEQVDLEESESEPLLATPPVFGAAVPEFLSGKLSDEKLDVLILDATMRI